ncbi:MAG: hypothetical protein WCZ22_02970 [Dehalococcoidales bacterium]
MSVLSQSNTLQINQSTGQYLKIEQSNLLSMPLSELNSVIREIENSELFVKCFKENKIIRYQRFDNSDTFISYLKYDESALIDNQPPEIDSLLENNKKTIEYIRKIGQDNFKKYFLIPEEYLSEDRVAFACGIPVAYVRDINNLVNDMAVLDEFHSISSLNVNDINYTKVASIDRDGDGFKISYYLNSLARGRYLINYEMFEEHIAGKCINDDEVGKIRSLFKKLEMINVCKQTLHSVLINLIQKQSAYIDSGNFKDLLPLSQKELAFQLGINPAALSRATKCRTIDLPCGREVTLKSLFPNPRKFRMAVLKKVLQSENNLISDRVIQSKLSGKYGVNISRRTVANMRKELKIPAGGAR